MRDKKKGAIVNHPENQRQRVFDKSLILLSVSSRQSCNNQKESAVLLIPIVETFTLTNVCNHRIYQPALTYGFGYIEHGSFS